MAIVAVAALAIASIGSVLALLTDTVSFAGAVESNDWTSGNAGGNPPGPDDMLDLRVKTGACDPADDPSTFSDAASISMDNVSLDLASIADVGSGQIHQVIGTYCLHNASAWDGRLYPGILSTTSVEVGDCDADEATVDSTCLAGEAGELGSVTDVVFSYCDQPAFYAHQDDWDGDGIIDDEWIDVWGESARLLGAWMSYGQDLLAGGDTCTIEIALVTFNFAPVSTSYGDVDDPNLLQALSDSLTFDLFFDLQEF